VRTSRNLGIYHLLDSEHLKANKLRALAAGSQIRIESLPEVPTVSESGYKDFDADYWFGLFAPAKTPKDTVSQLAGWFAAALQAPEVKPKLVTQGLYQIGMCGTEFGAYLRKKYDEYGRIIRESSIKAE
jgi:tripartite-type tricarboxylate transporter receptor subunit TctC